MKKALLLGIISSILLSSCANIYFAPRSVSNSKTHQKIAIIPPTINLVERKTIVKEDANADDVKNQLSTTIQNDMYSWMQKRNIKKNVQKIEIIDVDKTNEIFRTLEKNISNDELCKKLGVDAVLITKFSFEKKYGDLTATILYFITGGLAGINKSCSVNANLYYCSESKNGWTYDWATSGYGFSSYNGMSNSLIKHFSKKSPYTKKRDK
jgi:hypothetical protein